MIIVWIMKYMTGFWLRFMMGMMAVSLHSTNTNVNGFNKVWRGVCVFLVVSPLIFLQFHSNMCMLTWRKLNGNCTWYEIWISNSVIR